jgi:hypothetical protein
MLRSSLVLRERENLGAHTLYSGARRSTEPCDRAKWVWAQLPYYWAYLRRGGRAPPATAEAPCDKGCTSNFCSEFGHGLTPYS